MFKKILIANRGEVALRILAACRELGITPVAVYSVADCRAQHVRLADERVCIGPAPPGDSYLSVAAIVEAAVQTHADAVHPGYGFLSESAALSDACAARGVTFIGPPSAVLRLTGDKVGARAAMRDAGLSVVPGTDAPIETTARLHEAARGIGYPVIIKARAGGGGRGLRVVDGPDVIEQAWATAGREAEAACGDGRRYLERHLASSRHIEVQVLADDTGALILLGERECSIQRRHQKILEESPSVALDDSAREELGRQVADAVRAVGYRNAGTFEFLRDEGGQLHFLEVNARLQVEHPVTEMVTGVDIVKEQIRIAAGSGLSVRQADVTSSGHAIECRVNAESPLTGRPTPGVITAFSVPAGHGPGVRVDTAMEAGCEVTPHYDSLVAKVITHGRDRVEAIARMRRVLRTAVIEGIETTIPLHLRILDDPDFRAGNLSTAFLERFMVEAGADARGVEP